MASNVDALYASIGATPDPAGKAYWDARAAAGEDITTAFYDAAKANGQQVTHPTSVVAGAPTNAGDINIADYSGQLVTNPGLGMQRDDPSTPDINESTYLQDHANAANTALAAANGTISNTPQINASTYNPTTAGSAATSINAAPKTADGYTATHTADTVAQDANQVHAATGTVNSNDLVDPAAVTQGLSQTTTDALNSPAIQGLTTIDTSNEEGKARAALLGEGNYIDSKATVKGQLDILQAEFKDNNGNPTIPSWAAGVARNVGKIASFRGMTATAATAALGQAILEASMPIAESDSKFYQTVTLQNLSDRQEMAINKANVLSKLDLQNADARTTAAIQNAQTFMQMDLANLNNEQQSRVINTQDRIQSILSDANADNVAKQFLAGSQNDMAMFYDNLNSSINMYNAGQKNQMAQFNTVQVNTAGQFNAQQKQAADTFNANMQFAVDSFNASWRQTVALATNSNSMAAAATDVKNLLGISQEAQNNLWDRADSLLDYAWKTSENDKDRANQILMATLQGQIASDQADAAGVGKTVGDIIGHAVGWIFGA